MSTDYDLWTEAGRDVEAENLDRHITTARVASAAVWPFLAAAGSEVEFANRKALVTDRLDRIAAAAAENDPALFGVVRASLEDGFDQDFAVLHGERVAAARIEATKTAERKAAEASIRAQAEREALEKILATAPSGLQGYGCINCGKALSVGGGASEKDPNVCKNCMAGDTSHLDRKANLDNLGDAKAAPFGSEDDDEDETKKEAAGFHPLQKAKEFLDTPADYQPHMAGEDPAEAAERKRYQPHLPGQEPTTASLDKTAGDSVEMATIPQCDVCKANKAAYDAKLVGLGGSWGYVCEDCFANYGPGQLGTGFGQRLVQRTSAKTAATDGDTSTCKNCDKPIEYAETAWVHTSGDNIRCVTDDGGPAAQVHNTVAEPKTASKTAAEYGGGSPKEGDTATCHKDGKKIQFFDGQWMHLNSDKPAENHNDVWPNTPREQAEADAKNASKTAADDTVSYNCGCKIVDDGNGKLVRVDLCPQHQRQNPDPTASKTAAFPPAKDGNPFGQKKPANDGDAGAPDHHADQQGGSWQCPSCGSANAYTQGGVDLDEALKAKQPIQCGDCKQVDQSAGQKPDEAGTVDANGAVKQDHPSPGAPPPHHGSRLPFSDALRAGPSTDGGERPRQSGSSRLSNVRSAASARGAASSPSGVNTFGANSSIGGGGVGGTVSRSGGQGVTISYVSTTHPYATSITATSAAFNPISPGIADDQTDGPHPPEIAPMDPPPTVEAQTTRPRQIPEGFTPEPVADPMGNVSAARGFTSKAFKTAAPTCSCATNSDGSVTTMLCPVHAPEDPCATMAAVMGQRRRGSIVNGTCTACGWSK